LLSLNYGTGIGGLVKVLPKGKSHLRSWVHVKLVMGACLLQPLQRFVLVCLLWHLH